MESDARYAASNSVPDALLEENPSSIQSKFSVGKAVDGRSVYLDFQATTPTDPRVVDAMMPFYLQQYGNPHSRTHAYGWDAESATEHAHEQVASLIGADARE